MSNRNISLNSKKILIIRFSSFGDIVFAMSTLPILKDEIGDSGRIDWLVRSDMRGVLSGQNIVENIYSFERKEGLIGLINLALRLRKENYDIVYDAHANVRSFIVRRILLTFSNAKLIIRKKERFKRFLLFKLSINKFKLPYKGMMSFFEPIASHISNDQSLKPMAWDKNEININIKNKIILVPSAAWEMKRWPARNWSELINLLPEYHFVILGGPDDKFCEDIKQSAPDRVENYAGKLSLAESCNVISNADFVVTGDTGLAQVADLTGRKGITLIGPTAFGHPTMGSMHVLEIDLNCRPCSKDGSGKCSQEVYKKCLVDITPQEVALKLKESFSV
jgi:heptosyltransferase-2